MDIRLRYIYPAWRRNISRKLGAARWSHSCCRASFLAANLRPISGLISGSHGVAAVRWSNASPRNDGERQSHPSPRPKTPPNCFCLCTPWSLSAPCEGSINCHVPKTC